MNEAVRKTIAQTRAILQEERLLAAHRDAGVHLASPEDFEAAFAYFDLVFRDDMLAGCTRRMSRIEQERKGFGLFAILTAGLELAPRQAWLEHGRIAEQEAQFCSARNYYDLLWPKRTSRQGHAGMELVFFVGLILASHMRQVWKSTQLRDLFEEPIDILDEMRSIWVMETRGASPRLSPFSRLQTKICESFGLSMPEGCQQA